MMIVTSGNQNPHPVAKNATRVGAPEGAFLHFLCMACGQSCGGFRTFDSAWRSSNGIPANERRKRDHFRFFEPALLGRIARPAFSSIAPKILN
jgi:hypothetical protein